MTIHEVTEMWSRTTGGVASPDGKKFSASFASAYQVLHSADATTPEILNAVPVKLNDQYPNFSGVYCTKVGDRQPDGPILSIVPVSWEGETGGNDGSGPENQPPEIEYYSVGATEESDTDSNGLPYTNVTGDLKAANYSSIRAGTVEFRRRMDQFQHATLIYQLCRPVWKRWLETAALSGALNFPGYFRDPAKYSTVKWITPKWEWVDPLKDRQAEKIAQECGWKAPSDIIEAEGYDVDETYRRIAADQKRADGLGIRLGKPEQAAPIPTPFPEGDDDKPQSQQKTKEETQ